MTSTVVSEWRRRGRREAEREREREGEKERRGEREREGEKERRIERERERATWELLSFSDRVCSIAEWAACMV